MSTCFLLIALHVFVSELGAFIVVFVRAAVVALSAHVPRCCSSMVAINSATRKLGEQSQY